MKRITFLFPVLLITACGQNPATSQGQSSLTLKEFPKVNGLTPYMSYFVGQPDAKLEARRLDEWIALSDKSSRPYFQMMKDLGGSVEIDKMIAENSKNPQIIQQQFQKYGMNFSLIGGGLSAQNIFYPDTCEKFFPPGNRLTSYAILPHLMNSTVDADGRPVYARKTFPAYGFKARDPGCQRKVGNLFDNVSHPEYQGGHLIGYETGGYPRRLNMAPQNQNFNGGRYRDIEKELRSCTNLWKPSLFGTGNVLQEVGLIYDTPTTGPLGEPTIIPGTWAISGTVINQKKRPPVGFTFNYPFVNVAGGGTAGATYLKDLRDAAKAYGCGKNLVSFVIDDTGSMGGGLAGVTAAMTDYVATSPVNEDIQDYWNLVTFKDSSSNYGYTDSRDVIVQQLASLYPDGGGDCPEDVLGGVSSALSTFNSLEDFKNAPKDIIVVTDASAQPGDVDAIIAKAQATTSAVHVISTGNCGMSIARSLSAASLTTPRMTAQELSGYATLKRIAEETGGTFQYIPGATYEDYKRVMLSLLNDIGGTEQPTDTEPPTINIAATPAKIWPPNHKMVRVNLNVQAQDNVDSNPVVSLVGVASSETNNGQGDGNTATDVSVTPAGEVYVRAERSGQEGQRTYTITYSASDAAGNTSYATAEVVVGR